MKTSCVSWRPLGSFRLVAFIGCAIGFARIAIADERENGQSLRGSGSLIFRAEQKLLGNDTAENDHFGQSVAIDGETIVVGAPYDSDGCPGTNCVTSVGAAYVFRLDNMGTPNNPTDDRWVQQVKLRGMDTRPAEYFGSSVGISGNVIAVGAPYARSNSNSTDGAVYVFVYNGVEWHEQVKLTYPAPTQQFGSKVALHDGLLVVTNGENYAYSARVYVRGDSTWNHEVDLNPGGMIHAMSVDENIVAIGASNAVALYRRDAEGWHREARLTSPKPFLNNDFDRAVSIKGDMLIVGSPNESEDICPPQMGCNFGAAYLFQRSNAAWSFVSRLIADERNGADQFGSSVAVGEGYVFVGARYDDGDCTPQESCSYGSINGFVPVDGSWQQQVKFVDPAERRDQNQGTSLAVDGFRIVAGADGDDERGQTAGAAFTYIAFQDCNSNEIPDQNEPDCNGNSVPDDCDIQDGLAVDCNGNIVPDDCDLAKKSSVDCDGNDVPDECDTLYTIQQSAQLGPVGAGMSRSFTIPNAPRSGGPVTLSFTARGDFGSPSEAITVDINGSSIGTILDGPEGHDCPTFPDMDQIVIGNGEFNSALNESGAVIHLVPSSAVDPNPTACSSFVTVRVAYQAIVPGDCNGNGIPDVCDLQTVSEDCNANSRPDECEFDVLGDFDGNRTVALADSAVFIGCLTGPCVESECISNLKGGSCCPHADFDFDGDVDLNDVARMQRAFGPTSP